MQNDMRDRLIELLKKADSATWGDTYESYADYLIANGAILPPFKRGDTVYVKNRANKPQEMIVESFDWRCSCKREDDCMCGSLCGDKEHNICQYRFMCDFSDIGKTVFLTEQEAREALKGGVTDTNVGDKTEKGGEQSD